MVRGQALNLFSLCTRPLDPWQLPALFSCPLVCQTPWTPVLALAVFPSPTTSV